MAAIYSNENFPLPVVQGLRERGHDVLTIQEAGRAGYAVPDAEVLAHASDLNRAVLTLNRKDFIRLHLASGHHAGIVVCTFDPDFLHRLSASIRRSLKKATFAGNWCA